MTAISKLFTLAFPQRLHSNVTSSAVASNQIQFILIQYVLSDKKKARFLIAAIEDCWGTQSYLCHTFQVFLDCLVLMAWMD